ETAFGTAQEAHRLRVPELSPARQPDRLREPGDPALLSEREPEGSAEHGRRHPRSLSDRRQEGSLSESALGWTTAAGRRGARGHRESAGDPRRRADRQPALRARQGNHGAVPLVERKWRDDRPGNAFRGERVLWHTDHPVARRLGGGRGDLQPNNGSRRLKAGPFQRAVGSRPSPGMRSPAATADVRRTQENARGSSATMAG